MLKALPHLVQSLEARNPSTQGDEFEEAVAKTGLPMTIASAIKTTVGAQKLMINWEDDPIDFAAFRENLNEIKSSADSSAARGCREILEVALQSLTRRCT